MDFDIIHKNLEKSIAGMLSEFFTKHVPSEALSIAVSPLKDLSFTEHMVIILLTNAQIRMFLKIHFHIEAAQKLASVRQHKPWQSIPGKVAIDFMKELCNVLGGRLKQKIAHLDIELGQSIPLDLEGFSEIFFKNVNWDSQNLIFDIGNSQLSMQVSSQYEITGKEAQAKLLAFTESGDIVEDDIEFL